MNATMTRAQSIEIGVAAVLVARAFPQLDHDEIGVLILRALEELHPENRIILAHPLADHVAVIVKKSFGMTPVPARQLEDAD